MKSHNLAFWTKEDVHNFGRNLDEKLPTDRGKNVKFFHIYTCYDNAFAIMWVFSGWTVGCVQCRCNRRLDT